MFGFEEHAIPTGVWGAVCDAVLHDMHVNAGAQITSDILFFRTTYNFLDGEVELCRVFAMHEGGSNPHFVCNLDSWRRSDEVFGCHDGLFVIMLSNTKYFYLSTLLM